ncbi:hypothetical protein XENORESO_021936 [Xenotaenia resolanae]|uniref:Uncharacterized protein n=1 Tax=Xenotaenia resolanae TaxID=208358 RepID=A0ABV0X7M3_9TELE
MFTFVMVGHRGLQLPLCGAAFISTSCTILVTECDGNINLVPVGLNIVVIAPTVDICNFLSCLNGLFFFVTSYYSQGKQEVTAYKSDLPRNGSSSVKNQLHLFLTELLDVLITVAPMILLNSLISPHFSGSVAFC